MKIRNKMMLGFSLLISTLFTLLMVVLSFTVRNSITEDLKTQLKSTTDSVRMQVTGFIDISVTNYLRGVAEQNRNHLMARSGSPDEISEALDDFTTQRIGSSGFTYVYDEEGIIVSHPDEKRIGMNADKALDGKAMIQYRVDFSLLDYTIAVTANEEELLSLLDYDKLGEQILSLKIGNNGFPYIFSEESRIIVHPELPFGSDVSLVRDLDGIKIYERMIKEAEGSFFYEQKEEDGKVREKFNSFSSMDSPRWVIATTGYKSEYFSLMYRINGILIFSSLISLALILLFVFITSSILVKPITGMTNLLKDISEGDGDLTRRLNVRSGDETSSMADYFNIFAENIRNIIENVKSSTEVTVNIREELSTNFEESVASLDQIDSNLQSVNSEVERMDQSISASSLAVENIIGGIEQLDNRISEQSGAVEESTASVTQMVSSLKSVSRIVSKKREAAEILVNLSKKGGEQINKTHISFKEGISDQIAKISEMTSIIKSISSQTNLLSMNAAIEAAHAGDAGMGFSVVADEIRKLAENSSENSKKISEVIKSIVQHIEITGNHVDNSAEAFARIEMEIIELDKALAEIWNASEEVSSGGDELLTAMNILADISNTVRTNSKKIKDSTEIVSSSMTDVSRLSNSITGAVREVAEGSAEINSTMTVSRDMLVELGEKTEQVSKEVCQFITD